MLLLVVLIPKIPQQAKYTKLTDKKWSMDVHIAYVDDLWGLDSFGGSWGLVFLYKQRIIGQINV